MQRHSSVNPVATLAVLAHEDQPPVELSVVKLGDRSRRILGIGKRHQATALGARRAGPASHQRQHLPIVRKWSFGPARHIVCQVADVDGRAAATATSTCRHSVSRSTVLRTKISRPELSVVKLEIAAV